MVRAIRNFPFDIRSPARRQSATWKSVRRGGGSFCRHVLLTVAVGHAMIGRSENRRECQFRLRGAEHITAQAGGRRMTVHRETMTSRERLLTALNHQEPDRIPIDLGGNQTGIHRLAYAALLQRLGWDEKIEIMDAVQQLARPSEAVLQRLHVDTRYIHAGAAADFDGDIVTASRDGKVWHDLVDEFGVRWSMPDDAPLYMDITLHPLADATIEDVKAYPFPRGDDPGRFVGLA